MCSYSRQASLKKKIQNVLFTIKIQQQQTGSVRHIFQLYKLNYKKKFSAQWVGGARVASQLAKIILILERDDDFSRGPRTIRLTG